MKENVSIKKSNTEIKAMNSKEFSIQTKKSRYGTLALIFVFSLITSLILLLPTESEAAVYDTVRLHVIANSDSEQDQELKKAVYSSVCEKYGKDLLSCESNIECKEKILSLIPDIETLAKEELKKYGNDNSVRAVLSDTYYERSEFMGSILPAGEYSSLKIIIGEGAGHNCFSVLFPQMSMWVSTESSDISEPIGIRADGVIYETRLRTLEWLSDFITK